MAIMTNEADLFFEVGSYGPPALRVIRFRGVEAVSELFSYEIELAIEDPIELSDVVGQPASLSWNTPDGQRWVNGIIASFEDLGRIGRRFAHYRAHLVPKVWKLGLRRDCRIFQDVSVGDVVQKVLEGAATKSPPAGLFDFVVLLPQRGGGPAGRVRRPAASGDDPETADRSGVPGRLGVGRGHRVLAFAHDTLPASAGPDEVAEGCELDFLREHRRPRSRLALVCARGFDGFNSALVLRGAAPMGRGVVEQRARVVFLVRVPVPRAPSGSSPRTNRCGTWSPGACRGTWSMRCAVRRPTRSSG